jgi:hypothetical protein
MLVALRIGIVWVVSSLIFGSGWALAHWHKED